MNRREKIYLSLFYGNDWLYFYKFSFFGKELEIFDKEALLSMSFLLLLFWFAVLFDESPFQPCSWHSFFLFEVGRHDIYEVTMVLNLRGAKSLTANKNL